MFLLFSQKVFFDKNKKIYIYRNTWKKEEKTEHFSQPIKRCNEIFLFGKSIKLPNYGMNRTQMNSGSFIHFIQNPRARMLHERKYNKNCTSIAETGNPHKITHEERAGKPKNKKALKLLYTSCNWNTTLTGSQASETRRTPALQTGGVQRRESHTKTTLCPLLEFRIYKSQGALQTG